MAKIHVMLQGKGGVSKTFCFSTLGQYYGHKNLLAHCIDTDPVNATLSGYKALNVVRLEIMNPQKQINARNFDHLIQMIATTDRDMIIDNGSSSFVPLTHYLITNQVPALIHEMGHELVIHTVVTGGQALIDTVSGFGQLASQFPKQTEDADFVIWLNPYWGPIQHDGKTFEEMKAYKDNKGRIKALVKVPELDPDTFGRDVSDMLQSRQTFAEALADSERTIMTRQRLKLTQDKLFQQLDVAGIV
jgi:hypothetical protein